MKFDSLLPPLQMTSCQKLTIGTLSSARRQALERQRHRKETRASMGKPHKTLCVLVVDLNHANLTSW